jgi:hypothetical protein
MNDGRDGRGRFAVGNRGGPGRPRRATEAEYLRALCCIVSLEDLRAIARRAVADAKKGSARARDWVTKYLLGDPAPQAPPSADRRQQLSQELLRAARGSMSEESSFPGPAGGGCSQGDQATGGPGAAAPQGPATPLPSEEQL